MQNEDATNASPTSPNPQQVQLVKPPKKLNEMTEEELRSWANGLGEAFKAKQTQPKQEEKD